MKFLFARRRFIRTFAAAMALLLFAGFLAQPRFISTVSTVVSTQTDLHLQSGLDASSEKVSIWTIDDGLDAVPDGSVAWFTAGFPFDAVHWTSGQNNEFGHEPTRMLIEFGPLSLDIAILLWCLWLLLAFCWQNTPGLSLLGWIRSLPSSVRRASIVSALLLFLLTTGYVVYRVQQHSYWRARGTATWTCSITHPLLRKLPPHWTACWRHVVSVSINEGNIDSRSIPATAQIVSLRGDITSDTLDSFSQRQLLHTVRWLNAPSSRSVADLIDKAKYLSTLSVSFGQHEIGDLIDVSSLQRLHRLELIGIHSDELSSEGFRSHELRSIELGFETNDDAIVHISSLPKLERLYVSIKRWEHHIPTVSDLLSTPRQTNHKKGRPELILTLHDVPALQTIEVDPKYSLNIAGANLISLREILAKEPMSEEIRWAAETVTPLLRSFDVSGAKNLRHLSFRTHELETLRAVDVPNLTKVTIGVARERRRRETTLPTRLIVQNSAETDASRKNISVSSTDDEWMSVGSEHLIQWLRTIPSLESIELTGVDLRGIDLKGLADCKRLSELRINRCLVDPHQLARLKYLPSLRSLSLWRTDVLQSTAETLLAMHDDWKELELNWHDFESICITDQPYLAHAFFNVPIRARSVELVNLPRLTNHLSFSQPSKRLVLRDLPQVTEVQLHQVPKEFIYSGMSGIRQLMLQQTKLDDALLDEIQRASMLNSLHLIDCRVPHSFASRVERFALLNEINLTLTPVQDLETIQWLNNRHLRRVVLDHSNQSPLVIKNLANCTHLQLVSLRGWDITPELMAPLIVCESLYEVCVDHAQQLPNELLSAHCDHGTLSLEIH